LGCLGKCVLTWKLSCCLLAHDFDILVVGQQIKFNGKRKVKVITHRFLHKDGEFCAALQAWVAGGQMHGAVFKELFGYVTALTVMMRLESRHHLVHQKASISRGKMPTSISGDLRRIQNGDHKLPEFKVCFVKNYNVHLCPSSLVWFSLFLFMSVEYQ
jgi:hypothetical protein